MAGFFSGHYSSGPKKVRIEIIPLIDVIFFLLATFVLFTLSLNAIQSVPVDLPNATTAALVNPDDSTVVLQISDAGTAYWNRELIGFNEIASRLADYKNTQVTPRVLITGGGKARYGAVVIALDEVRKAGITQVSIETAYRSDGR